jgi:hypothetical protein
MQEVTLETCQAVTSRSQNLILETAEAPQRFVPVRTGYKLQAISDLPSSWLLSGPESLAERSSVSSYWNFMEIKSERLGSVRMLTTIRFEL